MKAFFKLTSPIWILCILFILAGCFANVEGGRTARHISNNEASVAHARLQNQLQQQQLLNQSIAAAEQAKTDRVLHREIGATERLNAQAQYLLAMEAEGTRRFNTFMVILLIIAGAGGTVGLFIYLRNNPRPHRQSVVLLNAPQNQLNQIGANSGVEMCAPVPYDQFANDPRFPEYGWGVGADGRTGVRVVNGQVVQQCRLLAE